MSTSPPGGPAPDRAAPAAAVPGAIVPGAAAPAETGDAVEAELRRAFAAHPDLVYGGREWAASIRADFNALRGESPAGAGLEVLAGVIAALPAALGRTEPGLTCGGVLALRTPAIFLRTADPLLAAVVDACGSGSYAHRARPWVLRACFADPDQEPAADFPFLFGPDAAEWEGRRADCEMDAWRIAFGIFLFGRSRDSDGRPRPEARAFPGREGWRGPVR